MLEDKKLPVVLNLYDVEFFPKVHTIPIFLKSNKYGLVEAEFYITDDEINKIKVTLPDIIIDIPIDDFVVNYSKDFSIGTESNYSRLKISDAIYLPAIDYGCGFAFQLKYGLDTFVYEAGGLLHIFPANSHFKDGVTVDKLISYNRLVNLIGRKDCQHFYVDVSSLYPLSFLPTYLVLEFKDTVGFLHICGKNFNILDGYISTDIKLSERLWLYIEPHQIRLMEVHIGRHTLIRHMSTEKEVFPLVKRCMELKKSYHAHDDLVKTFYPPYNQG